MWKFVRSNVPPCNICVGGTAGAIQEDKYTSHTIRRQFYIWAKCYVIHRYPQVKPKNVSPGF